MTTIENDFLKVSIQQKGAELTSVYNKSADLELLWQADPNVWGWHAPNLFPIVGGVLNDDLLIDGEVFKQPRHGFARYGNFKLFEQGHDHAYYSLKYTDETLQNYPYKFDFQVLYTLIDNALRIVYKVINMDDKTIYFSVGGHPAFNIPFYAHENYEDYYIEFEGDTELHTHVVSKDGFFTGSTAPVKLTDKKLALTTDLFNDDALVFKNIRSKMITIKSDNHNQAVSVEYPHFHHLGLWSKTDAPFVCIEPWLGYTDKENTPTDIKQKEAIQSLKQGHTFEANYYISI